MKTKLLTLKAAGIALVLSSQVGLAQTGGTYLSAVPDATTKIYFKDFDKGSNENAAPTAFVPTTSTGAATGADPSPGVAPFGYSDTTIGNSAGNDLAANVTFSRSDYRGTTTDVDLAAPTTGLSVGVVALNAGGGTEHLYYTVNFPESGNYHIDVNYGHTASSLRKVKFELLDVAFANPPVLLANGSLIKTNNSAGAGGSSTLYSNSNGEIIYPVNDSETVDVNGNTIQFDVAAGTYVIKFTNTTSGPNYVWFKFVRDGDTLSTNAFDKGANALEVYPNPSNNGQFNLSIESKWEVYSVLGAKIAEGEGTKVDLSNAAKGAYILKTGNTSKKLIVN